MFYFKDAPLNPSEIDPAQLAQVQEFQSSLGNEGALYWKFMTLEEFEPLLRLHLARQIQAFAQPMESAAPSSAAPSLVEEQPIDELGLLDFLDLVEEHFGALNEITERISTETSTLGQKMQERTLEMNAATTEAQGGLGRRAARALIEKGASDMMQYVARMNAEIPLFKDSLRKGADAAARAALIGASMSSGDRQQVREVRAALAAFSDALGGAYDSTSSFKGSVQGIPRMTVVLNKAKRETAAVLGHVLESIAEGRRVTTETVRALDAFFVEQDA